MSLQHQHTLVTRDYQGHAITYQDDGWFNATQAASRWGKNPAEWLRLPSTIEYLSALKRHHSDMGKSHITRKGNSKQFQQGTWLHPKLAVPFARWLDADFAVWCDSQIDGIIRGSDDWKKLRHMSVASAKLMAEVIKDQKVAEGKELKPHHFSNEHCLVNSLITGKFKGIQRNSLTLAELDFIGKFDVRNSLLIAKGMSYEERKATLTAEAAAWLAANASRLPSANDPGKLAA
ncbi:hypothetical protein AEP_00505 [Curvibacter sp. AEP1-3]|uniref:KilA-N domain-containing protein n=1 Tax=Curvibacter sp. AEP1-3 TaxID=1844971 RepID=UPI000B562AF8|nr:KilA-N domain-containing protein [Curvibacter sp. AEP1-3]ARV17465.1 hypothetical protein AEP_00505 [Curvibacter sp. AEP1-3]